MKDQKPNQLSRRSFLTAAALTGLGVAGLYVTGCAPAAPTAPKSPEPSGTTGGSASGKVTLEWIALEYAGNINDNIRGMVAEWNKLNPNVQVNVQFIPFDNLIQKLSIAMAARSGIDVFHCDGPLVPSYAFQDVLLPLDEFVSKEDIDDILPASRETSVWEGKYVAPPLANSCNLLYYNREMAEKAGVTPPPPDQPEKRWTWAQALDAAVKMTKRSGAGTDVWGLILQQIDRPYQLWPLMQSNGAKVISDDLTTVTGYINSPEAVEACQFYQDLFQKHKVTPLQAQVEAFGEGRAAMFWGTTSQVGILQRNYPNIKWGVTPHPYFKKPVTPMDSWHLAAFKHTRYPQEVGRFMAWVTDRERSKTWYTLRKDFPARKSIYTAFPDDFKTDWAQLVLYENANTAIPRPRTPGFREYEDLMREAFRNIKDGAPVKQTLDDYAKRIDEQLAKYAKK